MVKNKLSALFFPNSMKGNQILGRIVTSFFKV